MHGAYLAFGWGIIAFGRLHVAATTRLYESLTQAALWFASAGLLIILSGALNLVNRAHGRRAPSLRRLAVGTNLALTAFAVLSAAVGHATLAEWVIVGGLFGGVCVLSIVPAALTRGGAA